jgi:hypothetical protein
MGAKESQSMHAKLNDTDAPLGALHVMPDG